MRALALLIIGFTAGYFFHQHSSAVFHRTKSVTSSIIGLKDNPPDEFITAIIYENGQFKPSEVTIRVGNYLTITNMSETLMWLQSDRPDVRTPRGYGLSEQLRFQPYEAGSIEFHNKLNLNAKATIHIIE